MTEYMNLGLPDLVLSLALLHCVRRVGMYGS